MKRLLVFFALTLIGSPAWIARPVSHSHAAPPLHSGKSHALRPARMSEAVTVHAAGGNPYINLSDGHELITDYAGEPRVIEALEGNQARPLSLASADFDEDGVPDLLSGYASPDGGGIVTLLRGNVDSIYPNAPEAKQRRAEGTSTDAPFLSPTLAYGVPEAADFVGAGDFDGDSHWDVVAAHRGGDKLYLLSGDGQGGLTQTRRIDLPSKVTALTVGEVNRRDGLEDVVVAVRGEAGAQVLVYEGPEGALRAQPEVFDAPEEVSSLALGQLDESYEIDLAIATGHDLMLVHGRDRRLSLDEERQREVKPARVEQRRFGFVIQSIAVGDFTRNHRSDIAVLGADGNLRVLSAGEVTAASQQAGGQSPTVSIAKWKNEMVASNSGWSAGARLVCARVSSVPVDSVVVVDRERHGIEIIAKGQNGVGTQSSQAGEVGLLRARLESSSEPQAVLPMRLNSDALSDLIVLGGRRIAPIMTQAQSVFTVTTSDDNGDSSFPTPGSLREAIVNANANPGLDVINFAINTSSIPTIKPRSDFPDIRDPVTIDGTTQSAGKVEIDASNTFDCLLVRAGNTRVRGLVINRKDTLPPTKDADVYLTDNGGNVIEGNFLGTNVTGTVSVGGYQFTRIRLDSLNGNGSDNLIGGTAVAARNIIVATSDARGIYLSDNSDTTDRSSKGNLIQGNYINVNAEGHVIPNVSIRGSIDGYANHTTIGGTASGAGNVVDVINMYGFSTSQTSMGNVIQGNFIGLDAGGASPLTFAEVTLRGFSGPVSSNTIGGTTAAARNVISHIFLFGPQVNNNLVQGNYIGTDVSGTLALVTTNDGVDITQAPDNTIGGATTGARNLIRGRKAAIRLGPLAYVADAMPIQGGFGVTIEGNYIGTDSLAAQPLGNEDYGVFIEKDSRIHNIKGNVIAFNGKAGIYIPNETENPGTPGLRILMSGNLIFSNGGLGIDLGSPGVTANDDKDVDTGANNQQNFPVLSSVSLDIGPETAGAIKPAAVKASISGTFNSTPNQTFTIEFFFGTNSDASGHQFVGATPIPLKPTIQVITDSNGNAPFTYAFELPGGASAGWVNSTATDAAGNTSEFSQCIRVEGQTVPSGPRITAACKGDGKQLIVNGEGFVEGAKVFLNEGQEKTVFVSANQVIAIKAGKRASAGDVLKVRNPGGGESPGFSYTKTTCSP